MGATYAMPTHGRSGEHFRSAFQQLPSWGFLVVSFIAITGRNSYIICSIAH